MFYSGLFVLSILLIIVALGFTLALRNQSESTTERTEANLERFLVEQCHEKNNNRMANQTTFEYFLLLLTRGNLDADPRARLFFNFVQEANDPVSCDINDPNFGVDTTPARREEIPVEVPR